MRHGPPPALAKATAGVALMVKNCPDSSGLYPSLGEPKGKTCMGKLMADTVHVAMANGWKCSEDEKTDDLVTFNFYHGGKLVKNGSGKRAWSYLGDLVSWFDYTESKNMSMLELWAMAKDISYEDGVAFYGEEVGTGKLIKIKTDGSILYNINGFPKSLHTMIVIFIGDENEQVQNVHEDEQVYNEDEEVVSEYEESEDDETYLKPMSVKKRDCTQTQNGTKAKRSTYQLSARRQWTMHKAIEEKERLRT
ncbi:PREDICTED: PRUPE_1G215100 [Prunus dulcis]|uniref:PREDICTED: PRUPE_1G215100 n=1 Tax=Prunus dulcis TaxID=3755 RepID=A0A5E4FZF0_PRUDU|nr:PREDICTED: PRUPE_1G215100 [Prunus dulcis]